TRPRPEGLGYEVSNQPFGDISIELHDAHAGTISDRYLPASSDFVDQVLGAEGGRLIQHMVETQRRRIFRHAPDPSDLPRSVADSLPSNGKEYRRHGYYGTSRAFPIARPPKRPTPLA